MTKLHRIAAAAAVCGLVVPIASARAQAPPPAQGRPPARRAPAQGQARPAAPGQPAQSRQAYKPTQYQYPPAGSSLYHPGNQYSVLRHYPHYSSEYSYGFRNPGGVGRSLEYYPPGNQFQSGGRDPVASMRPGFDQNLPVGSIQEQAMATQVGVQRYSALQAHLDRYAAPMYGFGFGFF